MKAIDFLFEHKNTDGSIDITLAKEAVYMAMEEVYRPLRNQYAGMALQGIISNSEMSIFEHKEEAVKEAVEFADILIEKLRKE